MHRTTTICSGLIICTVLFFAAGDVRGDDRVLLRAEGAPANVFLILDSGALMVHDGATNSINFLAAGDDDGRYTDFLVDHYGEANLENALGEYYRSELGRGAKLAQAKRALKTFFNTGFEFNYAFSYYEKSEITLHYLNYVYRMKETVERGGVEVAQPAMRNGTQPGTPLRFGRDDNMVGYGAGIPVWPLYFGEDGTELSVSNEDPFGGNTFDKKGVPQPGNIRECSGLVNSWDPAVAVPLADLTTAERVAQHMFYYPAWDWDGVSATVQGGLTGGTTWNTIATDAGYDTTDPHSKWELLFRDQVTEDIMTRADGSSNQIGSRTLYVAEGFYQVLLPNGDWAPAQPDDCVAQSGAQCPAPQVSEFEYVQHFVLYDHDPASDVAAGDTLSSIEYQGQADCQGYLDPYPGKTPIVPIDIPDPVSGATQDQTWRIETFLGPQTQPVFYFPNQPSSTYFLPSTRADFIPLTETVAAAGRRPIKDTINEIDFFFKTTVEDWVDPLAHCRMNFVILITDGEETCSGGTAVCSAAKNIGIPIYTIYLGTEDNAQNPDMTDVKCIGEESGGKYFVAGNEDALVAALLEIAMDIEERTRGFSSPIVPSVETSTEQTAYISTFTPRDGRSIWRGHLRSYPIDPYTGVIKNLRPDGSPNPSYASWDAGDTLSLRDASTRLMYFGAASASRVTPGERHDFSYPSSDSEADKAVRTYLGSRIFRPDPWLDVNGDEDDLKKAKLSDTIAFIRGHEMVRDPSDETIILEYGRDPEQYGWCAPTEDALVDDPTAVNCWDEGGTILGVEKLGDIFHSTPQLMGRPRCFECWFQNLWGYRDDLTQAGENDGFIGRHRYRRQVIFSGADDGALHAFEAGMWDPDGAVIDTEERDPQYDTGTGRELFAWVPEAVMHELDNLAFGSDHRWTVDSTPTVADVYIDPVVETTPTAGDREWRTVVLFGQRRGGRSYVALDVTNPDPYDSNHLPMTPAVGDLALNQWAEAKTSGRDPICTDGTANGCSGVWPAFKWEFFDRDASGLARDEDGNLEPDLGQTWSRPLVAFLRVDHDGNSLTAPEARMVAFFGGGFSPQGVDVLYPTGNFIYGLDIETGAILFKEEVDGMVPAEVTGLDINLDGFLERIYFATTAGNVYRMDLDQPGTFGTVTVNGQNESRITNWVPEKIFVAGSAQPFFTRPTLTAIAYETDGTPIVALAIGSGNRDDIMDANLTPHRFYVIADRGAVDANGDPRALTEADLVGFTQDTFATATDNYLDAATDYGWYLILSDVDLATDDWEKVNTTAVILEGFVIFSTFNPSSEIQEVPIYNDSGVQIGVACRRGGNARTYVMNLFNSNPDDNAARYIQHDAATAMATEPVVYLGADGKIHVIQALDNLQMEEPVEAINVHVRAVNWKEE